MALNSSKRGCRLVTSRRSSFAHTSNDLASSLQAHPLTARQEYGLINQKEPAVQALRKRERRDSNPRPPAASPLQSLQALPTSQNRGLGKTARDPKVT